MWRQKFKKKKKCDRCSLNNFFLVLRITRKVKKPEIGNSIFSSSHSLTFVVFLSTSLMDTPRKNFFFFYCRQKKKNRSTLKKETPKKYLRFRGKYFRKIALLRLTVIIFCCVRFLHGLCKFYCIDQRANFLSERVYSERD